MSDSICLGIKKDGNFCRYKAISNGYCRIHATHSVQSNTNISMTSNVSKKASVNEVQSCFTLTIGDMAENHAGMQQIGQAATAGLTYEKLQEIAQKFPQQSEIIALHDLLQGVEVPKAFEPAYILIIRKGLQHIQAGLADSLHTELKTLVWDTKAVMR